MVECQNIEWKESWNDDLLKWICGFANAQGGKLYIGISDDGSVCGVPKIKKVLEDIPNKVRDVLGIMVDINALKRDDKDVVEIVVNPSSYPINCRGEYHYRSGSTKQLLKGYQLTEFLLRKTGYRWDAIPVTKYSVDDLDKESFDIFRKEALRYGRMTSEDLKCDNLELLERLHLIDESGSLSRAAIMTFYRYPEKISGGSYVKIGYFENDADLLYQDEVHGSLLYQADRVIDLLFTKYLKAKITYDNVTRIETYPYPKLALREAVFNALVHNDYSLGVPIQISVYEDKLYIANDASGIKKWTQELLLEKHKSIQTNPGIANVFFRCGFIEAWGRGIEKICNECKRSGNELPVFNVTDCGFIVKFDALKSALIGTNKQPLNISIELDGIKKEIFSCILANQKVSRKSIAKQLGVSTKTIYRHLSEMREYVVCEGKGKGTFWRIVSANVPRSVHKNVPHSAAIKLDGVKGKIYNYILANPNVSINSISKYLDLSIDMISGCLSEMREYVVCEGQGEDTIFRIVPANVPINVPHSVHQNVPANIPHSAAIKLDGIKGEIYRCILANPNVSRMSIAKQLGVSVKTIGRHLSEMKKYVIYDGRGSRSSWKII